MLHAVKLEGREMPEGLRFSVSFNEELKFISEGLCVGGFREAGKWLDSGIFAISNCFRNTWGFSRNWE